MQPITYSQTNIKPNQKMIKKLHKRASASLPTLLWLMLLALLPAQLSARDFEYTYEGQTLKYTVLDEDAKTVER